MSENHLLQRRQLFFELSSRIAQIDNAQLRSLFGKSAAHDGWGKHQIVRVGRHKVFVKRIPLTRMEHENMFSTRNLYELPTIYNYGYGSAGMGVWRELVTQIRATNWVLSGEIEAFPLMYHYRVVPFDGPHVDLDQAQHTRYVAYWGGDANVGRYMLDRASAEYELALFLEHIPHVAVDWLVANPAEVAGVISQMQAAIEFLGKKGILHLDAHFFNVIIDSRRAYLTDFGLALDTGFELSPEEKQFYRQNSHYDYGMLLWNLGAHLLSLYRGLPAAERKRIEKRYDILPGASYEEVTSILLENVDEITSEGLMKLEEGYAAMLLKYRGIATLMNDYRLSMSKNNAKDTRFPNAKLGRMLKETGFVAGLEPGG